MKPSFASKLAIIITLIVFLTLLRSPAVAVPSVQIATEYYSVEGTSGREIRKSLNRNTPIQKNGRNFDGQTKYNVRWNFWWRQRTNSCRMNRVATNLDIKYTLPKLKNTKGLSPQLQQKWSSYMTALIAHEVEHKEIALDMAYVIEEEISHIQPAKTCQELSANANRLGNQIVQEFKEVQADFDRRTNHGATEGAVFP